jgi:hypothetical protein
MLHETLDQLTSLRKRHPSNEVQSDAPLTSIVVFEVFDNPTAPGDVSQAGDGTDYNAVT